MPTDDHIRLQTALAGVCQMMSSDFILMFLVVLVLAGNPSTVTVSFSCSSLQLVQMPNQILNQFQRNDNVGKVCLFSITFTSV